MDKKYPSSLFWIGVVTNMFGRFFYLFFPALLLLFIGIWNKGCLCIGLFLLALDIIFSLIEQMNLRKATIESDNENFREFQEAMLSPDWKENVKKVLEEKVKEQENSETDD